MDISFFGTWFTGIIIRLFEDKFQKIYLSHPKLKSNNFLRQEKSPQVLDINNASQN